MDKRSNPNLVTCHWIWIFLQKNVRIDNWQYQCVAHIEALEIDILYVLSRNKYKIMILQNHCNLRKCTHTSKERKKLLSREMGLYVSPKQWMYPCWMREYASLLPLCPCTKKSLTIHHSHYLCHVSSNVKMTNLASMLLLYLNSFHLNLVKLQHMQLSLNWFEYQWPMCL